MKIDKDVSRFDFGIDKNVAIPEKGSSGITKIRKRQSKYPLAQMEVGDSFFVHLDKELSNVETRAKQQALYNAANNWANKCSDGWKFATRNVFEDVAGIRVWRVK